VNEQSPSYCHECGAYKARRPIVEMVRNPASAGGAWEIFIFDPEGRKGVTIGVPDHGDWNVSPAVDLVDGMMLDPWAPHDDDSLREQVTHLTREVAELTAELAAPLTTNGVTA
jgi:hypothetical protein